MSTYKVLNNLHGIKNKYDDNADYGEKKGTEQPPRLISQSFEADF